MKKSRYSRWAAGLQAAALGIALCVPLFMGGRVFAAVTTISGTVKNGANTAVAGATLTFTDQTHPGTPLTTTSASDGSYSAALTSNDYYTVTADPPTGSGLVSTTYYQIQAAGTTQTLNFTLRASAHTVTGTVQDKNGVALPNETVRVKDANGTLATATTLSDGSYTLTAPSYNSYLLETSGTQTVAGAYVPPNFVWNMAVDFTSDHTTTVAVQATQVSLTVRGADGTIPVGNTSVNIGFNRTGYITDPRAPAYVMYQGTASGSGYRIDQATGTMNIMLLANSQYNLSVLGSCNDGYGTATTGTTNLGTTDTTQNVTLPVYKHTVSGTINVNQSTNGITYPGDGLNVSLTSLNNYRGATTTTDSTGHYTLTVPTSNCSGTSYRMNVSSSNAGGVNMSPMPGTLNAAFNVDMSSDRTGNITFPFDTFFFDPLDNLGQGLHMPVKVSASSGNGTLAAPFTGAGTMTANFTNNYTDSGNGYTVFRPVLHGLTYTISAGGMAGTVYGTQTLTNQVPSTNTIVLAIPNNMGVPNSPSVSGATNSFPTLSWSYGSASGAYVPDHYNIYRDNVLVGSSTTTSYTDTSLTTAGTYTYKITAVNSQATEGARSTAVPFTHNP